MAEKTKFQFVPNAMTVTELKTQLEEFESMGYGNAQLYGGVPFNLSLSTKQGRAIDGAIVNTLFGAPFVHIKIR